MFISLLVALNGYLLYVLLKPPEKVAGEKAEKRNIFIPSSVRNEAKENA